MSIAPGPRCGGQGATYAVGVPASRQPLVNWDPRRAPIADPGRCLVAHGVGPFGFPGWAAPAARSPDSSTACSRHSSP